MGNPKNEKKSKKKQKKNKINLAPLSKLRKQDPGFRPKVQEIEHGIEHIEQRNFQHDWNWKCKKKGWKSKVHKFNKSMR